MKCEVTATCNLLPPTKRVTCTHSFIFYIDPSGERSRYCMIQYYFEGPVVDLMSISNMAYRSVQTPITELLNHHCLK